MLVPYNVLKNGENSILKRVESSPWIDRLPLTIEYKISKYSLLNTDEVTSYMQLNIKENGVNMINKIFQINMGENFMVSMPTSNPT